MKNTIGRITGLAMIVAGTIGIIKNTKELINIAKEHNEDKAKIEAVRKKFEDALTSKEL